MPSRRNFIKGAGAVAAAGQSIKLDRRDSRNGDSPPCKWVLFLLDRSGSMGIVRQATVDGLKTYVEGLRAESDLYLSLIQFDSNGPGGYGSIDITETFDFTPIAEVAAVKSTDFVPRGGTPLLAAVCEGVKRLEAVVRPQDKALFVIQTDGDENTSPKEVTLEVVKNLLTAKQAEGNWTVVFMGADIDAWSASSGMAVAVGNTIGYQQNAASNNYAYLTTTNSTRAWARSAEVSTEHFYAPDEAKEGE